MIKNKNVLITGGAGFIGSNLFELLIQKGNFITIIDNFNDYYPRKEEQIKKLTKHYDNKKEYNLIKGDLLNTSIYDKIKYTPDIVFHLAAQAGVRYSIEHSSEVTKNNNIKKVVCASSSSVYGNPIYTPLDEEHPKNPISPYAVSKLCGELYANLYYREYNLPVTSLRFYTVYGPRGRPDMAIRKFFNLMLQDKEITIYGDGEQLRDFTYISDILNGLILAGEKKESEGEVFNLGCSNPIRVNELVNTMYSIVNKTKKIRYIEKQQGDVEITYSNIKKAEKMLGFHPKININEGLKKTFKWQVDQLSSI